MPILSNILIEAIKTKDGDQIRLAATNRNIAIVCWIGAKVEEEGAITIPARLLSEFVNSLPPERVDMELNARTQTLHLACARYTANMKGIDHFEFPLIPTTTLADDDSAPFFEVAPIALDATMLSTAISSVVFAASTDENRPTLTGVEFKVMAGKLTMAATDGFRLSVRYHDANGDDFSVIVPAGSLSEVAKVAADSNGKVAVYVGSKRNQMLFSMKGGDKALWQHVELVSELIDAKFPDYNATMPKSHDTTIKLSSKQLADALKVARLFARDNADIVRFSAKPEDGTLTLSANSTEVGDGITVLSASVDGPAIDIAFNGKYFAEALQQIDGEVVIELTTPKRPGLLYRDGHKAEFTHTIMPMMTK
jgi:DNA polymerase-3 subunit beta